MATGLPMRSELSSTIGIDGANTHRHRAVLICFGTKPTNGTTQRGAIGQAEPHLLLGAQLAGNVSAQLCADPSPSIRGNGDDRLISAVFGDLLRRLALPR